VAAVAAGAIWSATPAAGQEGGGGGQGPERVEGVSATLDYDEDGEEVPVPDVELLVETAQGEEVGVATSDDEGVAFLEVPGPGRYVVTLDTDTLPDGVELPDPDANVREVEVSPTEIQRVLFPIQVEGAESTREVKSDWERFLQLSFEGLKFGLTIAMMAIGLSLIFGTTGLVNFAHGEIVVIGAVVTWYLNTDADIWLPWATVIAMVLLFGFGAGLDRGIWRPLRRRGTSLIAMLVITIGLSIFLRYLTLYIFRGRPRAFRNFAVQEPYDWGPISVVPKDLWAIGISLVVLTAVGLFLVWTRTGKAIRAVADNPDLARSSGIDVDRVVLFVWGSGSALACLGGVLFAMSELVDWQFGFRLLLLMFAGVTLGGLGTAFGAFVGSLIVGVMIQVSTLWISPELKNVSALAVLILILVFRPQGIFGQRERIG
jgi:branched-chain amino acid transport system permease protein